jgi:hypothetical protein
MNMRAAVTTVPTIALLRFTLLPASGHEVPKGARASVPLPTCAASSLY